MLASAFLQQVAAACTSRACWSASAAAAAASVGSACEARLRVAERQVPPDRYLGSSCSSRSCKKAGSSSYPACSAAASSCSTALPKSMGKEPQRAHQGLRQQRRPVPLRSHELTPPGARLHFDQLPEAEGGGAAWGGRRWSSTPLAGRAGRRCGPARWLAGWWQPLLAWCLPLWYRTALRAGAGGAPVAAAVGVRAERLKRGRGNP